MSMLIAPRPANEAARLRMLRSLGILDTPAEEVFDRVTRVVSQLLHVPIALVSLTDENRQWFKSRVGMETCETPRDMAFCSYALEVPEMLVIEDTTADPRFLDNPLVTGAAHIRFYAGVPLRSEDGLVLGTLCALDTQPRSLPSGAATALKDLAAMVLHELLQRSVTHDLQAVWQGERSARALSELRFAAAFQQTPTGQALISLKGRFMAVNPKLSEITGYSTEELMSKTFADITHPDDHDQDMALVVELLAGRRQRYSLEKRYLHREGHPVWVEINVALVRNDLDEPDHFIAAILDISARKKHEALLQHHQEELEAKVIERTQELSSSRETLQVITDNLPVLIAQVDRDLCYRFNNDVYRQIFGVSPASLFGQSLTTVLRPELFEQLLPYFQRALAGERVTCEAIRYSLEQDRLWSSTYVPDVRNGQVEGFFVMSQDVTERVLVERTLLDKAMLDPLTELPNRRALQDYLQARAQASGPQQQAFALFFMDLDGFKAINDVHGHDAGDALLRQVAERLKASTRKEDFVCRLAGDEFVVIANGVDHPDNARRIAEVFCERLAQPFAFGAQPLQIGVSLGISLCPAGALTLPDTVLVQADGAMYEAKRRGRNGYHFAT
jgi:diguanylate cyclase (GGDEF)-like protein/PAS domain S-box-containing protein